MAVAKLARVSRLVLPGALVPRLGSGRRGDCRRILLDDLVQFAAIEPDAAAGWAIVDLYPLPV
jgi:hypothetical protein